jgi:hypothetical protein
MEVSMKKTMLAALASVSLIATGLAVAPIPAEAQARGGGGHGGFHGGGVRGGGFRGGVVAHPGGFRGGAGFYRGGGYRGYYGGYRGYGYPGYIGGVGLGFALGAALAYPWYYDYPAYGYYGYGGYAPVTTVEPQTYPGDPWAYDYGTSSAYPSAAPPQAQSSQAPQACGSWSWDPSQSKYNWVPC